MIEFETMPALIEDRQAYLRSLAGHHPQGIARESFRQRIGRTLVLFGQWIEGHREEQAEALPIFIAPRASVARAR